MEQHLIYSSGTLSNNELDTRISIVNSAKIILNNTDSLSSQLVNTGCEYIVIYNFDLNNTSITIPNNCILNFQGGSISNGTVTLQNTKLEGDVRWSGVTISGSCTNESLTPQMFGAYPVLVETEGNKTQHTLAFQNLARVMDNQGTIGKNIYLSSGHYAINGVVNFDSSCNFYGDGDTTIIDTYDGSGVLGFGYDSRGGDRYSNSCEQLSCTITVDAQKEQDYIVVDDTSDLSVGDYLILTDSNDGSFIRSRVYYRQCEIVKISNIEGYRVTLTSKLYGYYYVNFGDGYSTTFNPVPEHRTIISKFTPKPYNISNIQIISHSHSNANPAAYRPLVICGFRDSSFSGIHIENSGNYLAASIYYGIHFEVRDCVIRNYATYTGDAYGLVINNSQEFKVSNSKFRAPSHALATGGGSSVFSPINRNFIYENLYFENSSYDSSQVQTYNGIDLDVHSNAENYKFLNINCPHSSCDTGGYNVVIEGCKFYNISASFNNSDMTIKSCEFFTTHSGNLVENQNIYQSLGSNSIIIEDTKFHGSVSFNYQSSPISYDNFIFKNNNINGQLQLRNGILKNLVVENNTFSEGASFESVNMEFDNISFKHNVILDGYLDIISWRICNAIVTDNYIKTVTDNGTSDTQNLYFKRLYGYISNNIIERGLSNGHTTMLLSECDLTINNNIFKLAESNRNKQLVSCYDSRIILENNIHNCLSDDLIHYKQNSIISFGFSDYYNNLTAGLDKLSITNALGKTLYNRSTNRLAYVSPVKSSRVGSLITFKADTPYIGANILSPGKFYITNCGGYGAHKIYLSELNDISDPSFEDGLLFISDFNYGNYFIQVPYEGTIENYPYLYISTARTTSASVEIYSTRMVSDFDGAGFNVGRRGTTAERPGGSDVYVGFKYIDTDLGKPIFVKSITGAAFTTVWVESDGAVAGVKRIGTTAQRPTGGNIYVGFKYYDTDLNKEIYAGTISGNTVTWLTNTENQVSIVNVIYSELTSNALSTNINNYYNISGSVDTLNVTLNHNSENVIQKIIINLSTGSTPQITFTPSVNSETVSYFDYYTINANSNYELNIIWNGTKWIVAYNSYYTPS